MSEERMHIEASEYDAFYAAQHVARYQVLQQHCQRKTVLDIACGEGYGSWLLSSWGASSVLGIDISKEAIETAKRLFQSSSVKFHQHDAHSAAKLLAGQKFDVIACFETIEHLADPQKFLEGLAELISPDGTIVISCPNEKNDFSDTEENPFHLSAYTLQEFQALTEAVLGTASSWLMGTPQQGMVNFDISNTRLTSKTAKLLEISQPDLSSSVSIIPPMHAVSPNQTTCLYYIGVWGRRVASTGVMSPWSYPAFISPWQEIERLRAHIQDRDRTIETLNKRMNTTLSEISAYRNKIVSLTKEMNRFRLRERAKSEELRQSVEALENRLQTHDAELKMYRNSRFVKISRFLGRASNAPVIGPPLRLVRNIAAKMVR